jgi:hypothetical protein
MNGPTVGSGLLVTCHRIHFALIPLRGRSHHDEQRAAPRALACVPGRRLLGEQRPDDLPSAVTDHGLV